MTTPQIIFDEAGQPAFAVMPWREYERLTHADTDALLSDEALYDLAKRGGGEAFPIEVVDRLMAGENPVRVYRSWRGLTQKGLAERAGINPVYLSQIETGKRDGSTKTLTALAKALGVGLDDLV